MWLAVMTRILPDGAEFEYQYQKETAREIYKLAKHLCSTEEKAIVGIYSDPEFFIIFSPDYMMIKGNGKLIMWRVGHVSNGVCVLKEGD